MSAVGATLFLAARDLVTAVGGTRIRAFAAVHRVVAPHAVEGVELVVLANPVELVGASAAVTNIRAKTRALALPAHITLENTTLVTL